MLNTDFIEPKLNIYTFAVLSIFQKSSEFGRSIDIENIDLTAGQQVGRLMRAIIPRLWDQIGASNLYDGMLLASKIILGIGLLFLLYRLYSQVLENRGMDIRSVVVSFIWPIIAIALLLEVPAFGQTKVQTGQTNLWTISVALKRVIDNIDQAVISGIVGRENPLLELSRIQSAYQEAVVAIHRCEQNSNLKVRAECIKGVAESIINDPEVQNSSPELKAQAESFLENYNSESFDQSDQDSPNILLSILRSSFGVLGQQFIQPIIQGILIAIYFMFEILLEITFLLMAIIAPLAVGMSLFPLRISTVTTWLSGFVALGMTKISFHIIANIASYFGLDANYGGVNTVVFFLLGIAAPFIAGSVGSFSATGIQSGMSYMANMFIMASAAPFTKGLSLISMLRRGK